MYGIIKLTPATRSANTVLVFGKTLFAS